MLRITNFSVPFDDESPLNDIVAKRLKLPPEAVLEVVVVRKAIDARRYKNSPICFVYMLDVKIAVPEKKVLAKLRNDKNIALLVEKPQTSIVYGETSLTERPIVIGLGPAGLIAAWKLAKAGYKPLVLERGRDVDRRTADIQKFWQSGILDETSNVQFGEGGAGTFSDGKLTTRINDSKIGDIIELFISAGAPPEIRYLHKPHIGTDKLRNIVKNIRNQIIRFGGEVRFESTVTNIDIKNGTIKGIMINESEYIPCSVVMLAIGHSARDTYAMLHQNKIAMEAKAFAIGVRIEHPQEWIDRAQYHMDAGNPRLPVADYALTYQDKETGRGAYSFCMCPGGQVVAAASEKDRVVTNGMSNYKRNSGVANSALLVTVSPADFGSEVLDGIDFQRKYEALAFTSAGSNYYAPVQSVGDFLIKQKGSKNFVTKPTYSPGVTPVDLHDCLPVFVTHTLEKALPYFGQKIKGFDDVDVCMTGIETRSSAPCRIIRNRDFVSLNTEGLYPIGEGAGYAGGIMSAAIDGLNGAIAVMEKYKFE
ncbi:NAD(P)/FAD-dependent oxidoreductase [Anaerosinus massiliensis]|uniref:NAD(P)/FAD-dependent oxidoreductase n=1 Tax=Massilibacillus massiliensis TaxID=1806837 RepID=UPI000ACABD5B|nr:NAD(P)/FAD-dependent oxidoreductase [Massilibacillus massiliensis]